MIHLILKLIKIDFNQPIGYQKGQPKLLHPQKNPLFKLIIFYYIYKINIV